MAASGPGSVSNQPTKGLNSTLIESDWLSAKAFAWVTDIRAGTNNRNKHNGAKPSTLSKVMPLARL